MLGAVLGAVVITVQTNAAPMNPVDAFRAVVKTNDRAVYARAALDLRRWMIASDPLRPVYHFTGPESWINDPNGPIYYQGTYHLFYQFDPIVNGVRSARCWGHAVSKDLVHWEDWPVALWPDSPHDRCGVYSGNTFVDNNGDLCALYTGNVRGHQETYGILARSTDGGLTWRKKMVMDNKQRPNEQSPVHWDGFVWREGREWHQLIGGSKDGRGCGYLWTSPDLETWTLRKDIAPGIRLGGFWELPYLIPLGNRHVLMVGCGNPYWVGTYDRTNMVFTPDHEQPRSMDNGNFYSFNPNMTDDKGPGGSSRRIMHGWATIGRTPTNSVPYWEGAHALPRVLTLKGGRVWQEPVPELQSLRGGIQTFKNLRVTPVSSNQLSSVRGDALEIIATFLPGDAKRFGVKVRANATQAIRISFDTQSLQFNGQASDLKPGDAVTMHVFVDRSIVEVFVNGNAHTETAWHTPDAQGVEVFAEGGTCIVAAMEVWDMQPAW